MRKTLLLLANTARFIGKTISHIFTQPFELKEFLRQCYFMGYHSLSLIGLTSFIAGIVFTRQSRPSLESFGAESWLPSLVSQAVVRALGPLITGLICAGKLASNISAELGSMRVSEQIDAMEVSGTRPFSYLITTRVLATTLMIPVLVVYADSVALFGSFLNVNVVNKTSFALYVQEAMSSVTFTDVISSMAKAALFGFAIGAIGCYNGYFASGGTTGVGRAANTAVVLSMLFIFIIDLVVLQFTALFRQI